MTGPLEGITVVELAGLGPVPHAGMMLVDLGAEVTRVVRPAELAQGSAEDPHVLRGRRTIAADLKDPDSRAALLELISTSDALLEGFRPGVAERLGIGPQECLAINPGLIYVRVTGWGQDGPAAMTGGHDINYIAVTGALHAVGPAEQPVPPLSLFGNYGGGSMFAVTGLLAALLRRQRTGLGDVVDVSTMEGTLALLEPILDLHGRGEWSDRRADNMLDGGRPYYRTYRCVDGGFMAVGALEPHFYTRLLAGLGLSDHALPDQDDRDGWPQLTDAIATAFGGQPRAHWIEVFATLDACVTPVLTFDEAAEHPQIRAREALRRTDAGLVAHPAPRFGSSG